MAEKLTLQGRVFITFDIRAVTGLHIGGSESGIEIGGVDKTVIRAPLTGQPYIPGSSLRGKVRSLTEKYLGKEQNHSIAKVKIHTCETLDDYKKCCVCRTFGVPGQVGFNTPTRLIVRDVFLTPKSAQELREAQTDLPFTEVKTEVAIDRVTSVANPRQMERVPAGAVFGPAQLIYSVYNGDGCDPSQDIDMLKKVFLGLKLLEDDYLGGLGSRGSGQVVLENIRIGYKVKNAYDAEPKWITEPLPNLAALDAQQEALLQELKAVFSGA